MTEEEIEWVLISSLKRIRTIERKQPAFYKRARNKAVYGKINRIYGKDCVSDVWNNSRK